jgi:hypothetical protein
LRKNNGLTGCPVKYEAKRMCNAPLFVVLWIAEKEIQTMDEVMFALVEYIVERF